MLRASNTEGTGKALFEKLKCQQCHVLGAIPKDQPTANLAPDLRMAPERLQPDWIALWLKKPLDILPGTRMPMFWPDYPKSFYPELGGSAEAQILAIRDHLLTFKGGPSPKTAASAKSANNNDKERVHGGAMPTSPDTQSNTNTQPPPRLRSDN